MRVRLGFLVVGFLVLFSTQPSMGAASERIKLKEIPTAERVLNKGAKGVRYSQRSYKFYKATKIKLREDQSLTLVAWSSEFQPVIIVRRPGRRSILDRGTFDKPAKRGSKTWRVVRLDFQPEDRGTFEVVVTSDTISQGTYFIEGAIWGLAKTEPQLSSNETPGVSDAGLEGYDFDPGKSRSGPSFHWIGGAYSKNGKHAGSFSITWLEAGDSMKALAGPHDPKSGLPKVKREEGDVIYLEPRFAKDLSGKKVVRGQRMMVVDRKRAAHLFIEVEAEHTNLLPQLLARYRRVLAEHSATARLR